MKKASSKRAAPSSRSWRTVFIAAGLILVAGFWWNKPEAPKFDLIDFHESVGNEADAELLKNVMKKVGVEHTVLQAIPADLLQYTSGEVTLSEIDNGNTVVATASKKSPDQLSWFCAIDPMDSARLEALESCKNLGAKGVKLYNGYGYSHVMPLDDKRLQSFYAALEKDKTALMLPVNTSKFQKELENVLKNHPDLTVIASHYALASKSLARVTDLMTRYPNLWVDTSFGSTSIAMDGFKTMTENVEGFRAFFNQFQDRILWGTDNVIRAEEGKTEDFEVALFSLYRDILAEGTVSTFLNEDGNLSNKARTLSGLALDPAILKKVFWQNAKNLLE